MPDLGDAVDANPLRQWTQLLGRSDIEARYGLGRLEAINILERNGLGEDGGRVLRLRLHGHRRHGRPDRGAVPVGLRAAIRLVHGLRRPAATPGATLATSSEACPATGVPDPGYADVGASNVHERAIGCVTWWEIVEGIGGGRFDPARRVSRAQMATLVARLLEASGVSLPADPPDAFGDDDDSFHEPAIDALAAHGHHPGREPGPVRPRRGRGPGPGRRPRRPRRSARIPVTLPTEPPDAFADDSGSVHEPAINQLAAEGILTGQSAGRLEPFDPTRRDQMAALLARTLDLIVEQTGIATP